MTLSAPAAASVGDGFANVIGRLEKSLSQAQPLVTKGSALDECQTALSTVDRALGDVGTFDTVMKDVTDLVQLGAGLAEALIAVPFIGELAEAAGAVLDSAAEALTEAKTTIDDINRETVQPLKSVVDDINTGVADLDRVLTDVTVQVPQYINTIQILDYLLEIASPLADVLDGSEPGQRVQTVVTTLDSVLNDVGTAIKPCAQALEVVVPGVVNVNGVISGLVNDMGDGVTTTLDAFNSVSSYLQPICDGFNKVEDAIAPIRWVLDAVEWLVKEILEPAIDWVLRVTGLQTLIDDLKKDLLDDLGIGQLVTSLKPVSASQSQINSGQTAVGSTQAGATSTAFTDMAQALGQFRTNQNAALEDATEGLLTAITGTPIDPNKSTTLPDFPSTPPALTGNSGTAAAPKLAAAKPLPLTGELARIHSSHPSHPRVGTRSLIAMRATPAVQARAALPIPSIDPSAWPNAAALAKAGAALGSDIQDLSTGIAALQSSVRAFQASVEEPAMFGSEMQAFGTIFKTCDDLVTVVKGFNVSFLDEILQPIEDVVGDQEADLATVTTAMPQMVSAVANVATAMQDVIEAMPQATVVGAAMSRVDGWVLGAEKLVASMEWIKAAEQSAGNDLGAWTAAQGKIEASAGTVGGRVGSLAQTVSSLGDSVQALQTALDSYSTALTPITGNRQALAEAQPGVQRVAGILGTVDSIIDPLEGVFNAECTDSGGAAKQGAAVAAGMLTTNAQTVVQPPSGVLAALLQTFDADALPLGSLASALDSATATLTTNVVQTVTAQARSLAAGLTALGGALEQTQTYQVTDPKTGKVVTVSNDLVDQDLVEGLQNQVKGLPAPPASNVR
jgi:hypothetical protein